MVMVLEQNAEQTEILRRKLIRITEQTALRHSEGSIQLDLHKDSLAQHAA